MGWPDGRHASLRRLLFDLVGGMYGRGTRVMPTCCEKRWTGGWAKIRLPLEAGLGTPWSELMNR